MNLQYPLQGYIQEVQKHLVDPPMMQPVPASFDTISRQNFRNRIGYINTMSDHDLFVLVRDNITIIMEYINKADAFYVSLLNNIRFINALTKTISTTPIDFDKRLFCNKIAYDYFTVEAENTNIVPDIGIKQALLNLSKIVNRDVINQLMAVGLAEQLAANLAFCRYSNQNEVVNVKRLNFVICKQDPAIMTEQMIVWIYEKLFDRLTDLFVGTMFETYTDQSFEILGEDFSEVYGCIGLAVLRMVNNMPVDSIERVVSAYIERWEIEKRPVRFSLRSLSGDFGRIAGVVEVLYNRGFSIP